jgi:hypothetical protein
MSMLNASTLLANFTAKQTSQRAASPEKLAEKEKRATDRAATVTRQQTVGVVGTAVVTTLSRSNVLSVLATCGDTPSKSQRAALAILLADIRAARVGFAAKVLATSNGAPSMRDQFVAWLASVAK